MNRQKHVTQRSGIYYFRIRIPKGKEHRVSGKHKTEIWKSLGTRDIDRALVRASEYYRFYHKLFSDEEDNLSEFSAEHLKATLDSFGIKGTSSTEIKNAPTTQESVALLSDVISARRKIGRPTRNEDAVLGGAVELPAMTMEGALKRYEELSPEKFMSYADERERYKRWRPFVQAAKSFMDVMGNVDIFKLKPKDCFVYKAALVKEVAANKMKVETARKKIMWLRLIHSKVLEADAPELLPCPWDRVTIESNGVGAGKRQPFAEDELKLVRDALKASRASEQLKALNAVAQYTGATCKELTHLHKDDIFLDAPVPYIAIRPNENRNRVKSNGTRIREIPLVGQALEAMKRFPTGFDEFCRNNGSEELSRLSNVIIKTVVKDRTFYSYRHRMADLLRRSGCQDTLKNSIMGHSSKGMMMHYGEGYTLENKREALLKALPDA